MYLPCISQVGCVGKAIRSRYRGAQRHTLPPHIYTLVDVCYTKMMKEQKSQSILIFLSKGYFFSKNCLRELDHALALKKPLVLVHEADLSHGGAPLEVIMAEAESRGRTAVFERFELDADLHPAQRGRRRGRGASRATPRSPELDARSTFGCDDVLADPPLPQPVRRRGAPVRADDGHAAARSDGPTARANFALPPRARRRPAAARRRGRRASRSSDSGPPRAAARPPTPGGPRPAEGRGGPNAMGGGGWGGAGGGAG